MTPRLMPREVRMIPVDRIDVLNPRERDSRTFQEIVANIQAIGLNPAFSRSVASDLPTSPSSAALMWS